LDGVTDRAVDTRQHAHSLNRSYFIPPAALQLNLESFGQLDIPCFYLILFAHVELTQLSINGNKL
jgi:hypothetical protein